jgi:hypothetical protein
MQQKFIREHNFKEANLIFLRNFFVMYFSPNKQNDKSQATAGANPTTSIFTPMYNASVVVGKSVFQSRSKYFFFQNALGYLWRCKFLQRWRCNS